MSTAGNNVEQDIVNAAQDIFVEKGYDGATMREIAARAGINISMLHYYFRSKDNLFDIVFNRVFQRLYGRIFEVMASSEDLFAKLQTIVDLYLQTVSENPRVPGFILNEVTRRPVGNGRLADY